MFIFHLLAHHFLYKNNNHNIMFILCLFMTYLLILVFMV